MSELSILILERQRNYFVTYHEAYNICIIKKLLTKINPEFVCNKYTYFIAFPHISLIKSVSSPNSEFKIASWPPIFGVIVPIR